MNQLPKNVSHMGDPIVSNSHQEYLEKYGMTGSDHLFAAVEEYGRSHVDDLVGRGGARVHVDRVLKSVFGRVPSRTTGLPVIVPLRQGMKFGLSIEVRIKLSDGDPELLRYSPKEWDPPEIIRGAVDPDAGVVTGTFEASEVIDRFKVEQVVRWYSARIQDLCDAHGSWLGELRDRSRSLVENAMVSCREAWVSSRDSEAYIQEKFSIRSPSSAFDIDDEEGFDRSVWLP